MSTYKRVALAGATGNLGPKVLAALVSAGFEVTVLSRSGNVPDLPSQVKAVQVDYSSHDSLVSALRGHDVLVSNIPNHGDQPALIDACIAAGVKRFLPSEFGSNIIGDEKTAALPVFAGKAATQEYLRKKSNDISWTVVVTMFFLDWGLEKKFIIDASGSAPTLRVDGGNTKHGMTTLTDIAQAVVGVLRNPEQTHNRAVYVQSAATSQNELLAMAQKKNPAFKADVEDVTCDELLQQSYAKLKEGGASIGSAMVGFIRVSALADGYGTNWADKNDNDLLGIKEMSKEDLEELVGRYV